MSGVSVGVSAGPTMKASAMPGVRNVLWWLRPELPEHHHSRTEQKGSDGDSPNLPLRVSQSDSSLARARYSRLLRIETPD